ncbi:MAG: N-acetylmuramoyl-L-alanine amidase [Chthoniobacterales bacterium]
MAWLIFFGLIATATADFETAEIEGRDYVSLESIAEYYEMAAPSEAAKDGGKRVWVAEGDGDSIRVKEWSRETILNGTRQWASFPIRLKDGEPYVSRMDVSKVLDPAFRPEDAKPLPKVTTVVLDAGHGGHDKGASSRFGYEKEFALDLTNRVRKLLQKAGLKVVRTRTSDVFVELGARAAVPNKYKDSIFVSLHFNSAGWKPSANGIEIFALPSRGTPPTGQSKVLARDLGKEDGQAQEAASVALANAIYPSMLATTRLYDRGVKRARFAVLRNADVPAVLVEGGFLTNPAEAARIASATWRDELAESITRGILAYVALVREKKSPKTVEDYGGRPTTEFVPVN